MTIPFDQRYTVRPSYFFKGVFKHCHSLSGAIYARLFSLQCTREGCTGTCYTTIPHLEDEFGEKEYAITQALKRLKDCGLISTQIEKWSQGKRTRVFFNLSHEYLYEDDERGSLKTKVSGSPDNQGMGYPENQTTPIGGSPDNQGMGYPENQGQDTDILSTELSTGSFSTDSAHAQQQKSNRPKVIYPQCKEECYSLFTEQYQELISDYPELANIQINISALKFYNYYSGNRWTIKNRPIKSVEKTAQNWLLREIEKYNDKHGKDNDSPKPTDFALDIIKNTSNNGSPSTINADYEDVTDTQQPHLPNNKENANEQKGKAESTTL